MGEADLAQARNKSIVETSEANVLIAKAQLNKTDQDVMKLYGVEGTPANFVIDREGRMVSGKISGYGKGDTRVDKALKKAGLGAE